MTLCRQESNSYQSCIVICGRPILPPVMTEEKVLEMQQYKKLAVELEQMLETRKARSRDKLIKGRRSLVADAFGKKAVSVELDKRAVSKKERKDSASSSSGKEGNGQNSDLSSMTSNLTDSLSSVENENVTVVVRDVVEKKPDKSAAIYTNLVNDVINQTAHIKLKLQEEGNANAKKSLARNVSCKKDKDDIVFSKTFKTKMKKGKFFEDIKSKDDPKNEWKPWLPTEETDESFCSPGAIIFEGIGTQSNDETLDGTSTAPKKRESDISVTSNVTTPPSLASTDLQKYMKTSPDTVSSTVAISAGTDVVDAEVDGSFTTYADDDEFSRNSTVGNSSIVTTKMIETKQFFSAFPGDDDDCQEMNVDCFTPRAAHIRRSSYTLECPSPALAAHAAHCKENGCNIRDMSSIRRHSYPMTSKNEDTLKQCHCSEQVITKLGNDHSIKEAKEKHLQRYLETVSRCPVTIGSDSSQDISEEKSLSSECKSSPQDVEVLEQILHENQLRFEHLRRQLEEEHKEQMQRLMEQHTSEEERLRQHFTSMYPLTPSKLEKTSDTREVNSTPKRFKRENTYFKTPSLSQEKVSIRQSPLPSDGKLASVSANPPSLTSLRNVPKSARKTTSLNSTMILKFSKLSALVKGYLTRRLLKTEKVQNVVKTIRDTLEFAIEFHSETPIKGGRITPAEAHLHNRIVSQLTGACHDFHDMFFKLTIDEQMKIISHDRHVQKGKAAPKESHPQRNLSSATIKSMERKKLKVQKTKNAKNKTESRCKSAEAWMFSPKRRKIATERITRTNLQVTPNSRIPSPKLQKMLSCTGLVSNKGSCGARKNLSAIYGSETKNVSGCQTFRSTPKYSAVTSFSPSSLSKTLNTPWK